MNQGDQFCIRTNSPLEIGRIDEARRIGIHARDFDPQPAAQLAERPQDRIVLDRRRDNVVTRLEQSLQRQIQTVGAVKRENDAIGAFGAQQLGDFLAAEADGRGGVDSRPVGAASDCRPDFTAVSVDRRVDDFGLGKTGRRVVEINCQPPIEYIGR
jgi:hypothetical protein